MAFPKLVWDQLKNCTAGELIRALKADGWKEDITRGATRAFLNSVGPHQATSRDSLSSPKNLRTWPFTEIDSGYRLVPG